MRPWQHARSSASRTDRAWQQDLPIHELLDVTKASHPDLRHRLVLHNADLGPALVARAFPERPDAWDIAAGHVREDMGGEPSLEEWLSRCDLDRLPAIPVREPSAMRDNLVTLATRSQRLASDEGPRAVADLLMLPLQLCPDLGLTPLVVLCNSAGPSIVRSVLGPPRDVPALGSGRTVFDPAWVAEGMIYWIMGKRIPPLTQVASALRNMPQSRRGRRATSARASEPDRRS